MAENRAWSWRHAVLKSDLPATTRHVLLTISCFMNDVGGGCYPTQEQLAEATGLTDRAVRKHLDDAVSAGWLLRREHGFRGQKWRNHEYEASWPDAQHVEQPVPDVDEGAEPSSGPFSEGAERGSKGAEPDDKKVRNDVPPILPVQPSKQRVDARESAVAEFEEFIWGEFPENPNSDKPAALAAYLRLSREDRVLCMRGVARVSLRFDETVSAEPKARRLEFHPHLRKWIAERGWEAELATA
jgi:hypothetical protein